MLWNFARWLQARAHASIMPSAFRACAHAIPCRSIPLLLSSHSSPPATCPQAAQRGQKARPSWFVNIGDEMLGLGPDAGKEPAGGSSAPPKPEPTAAGGPGAKTTGGPGMAKAAEESAPAPTMSAAPAGEPAGAGDAEPGAVPLGVSEEDLFGDDWDDEEDEGKPGG